MNEPILSILIPTVYGREKSFNELLTNIRFQIQELYQSGKIQSLDDVEVKMEIDDKRITIGEKRESLYKIANGKYALQIDDDDNISNNAIGLIINAIIAHPTIPCITYREQCIINGEFKTSNHSIKYNKWQDNVDGFDYVRCPFYKDVIRTDIAKQVPFPYIRWNEDEQWSMAIKPLLTEEVHIDEEIYYYSYAPKESHEERYGLDKD
jgi:hypothetical protein